MTRTKQTAKKSNGGSAPRVSLQVEAASAPAEENSTSDGRINRGDDKMEIDEMDDHNGFCIICRDGAESCEDNTLYLCDFCPRVTCRLCMEIPPGLDDAILEDNVTFICICCHISRQQHGKDRSPYYGFYRDGQPVSTFLRIKSTFEISMSSQLSAAPIIMIHLVLVDFEASSGSPFRFAYEYLRPYFPDGGIEYRQIYYDIGSNAKALRYRASIRPLIKELKKQCVSDRIVFAISTHTDGDSGDPFVGYEGAAKHYVGTPVDQFLDIILAPWEALLDGAGESYLWFFCCGSLVNNSVSFAALRRAVVCHKLTATFAFNAIKFQPSFTSALLLAFTDQVLVERRPLLSAVENMLAHSQKLGQHTNIFVLTVSQGGALCASKYVWTHRDFRPWGGFLPIQCPRCGYADAWRSAYVETDKAYSFECCNDSCSQSYIFSQPPGARMLTAGKARGSGWMEVPLSIA